MREMFAGEYACKLDEKGRFSVPMPLRQPFGLSEGSGTRRAMLVKSQRERCLWLLPVPNWRALLELQQQRLSERESRLFMHHEVTETRNPLQISHLPVAAGRLSASLSVLKPE